MTLPHESKEGAPQQGEAKETGSAEATARVTPEDGAVAESASGGQAEAGRADGGSADGE